MDGPGASLEAFRIYGLSALIAVCTSMDYLWMWNIHGISMEYLWNIYGISMEYLWNTYGISMEYLLKPAEA